MKSLVEGMNVFKWPFESFKLKRLAVLLFPLFVNVVKTIQAGVYGHRVFKTCHPQGMGMHLF